MNELWEKWFSELEIDNMVSSLEEELMNGENSVSLEHNTTTHFNNVVSFEEHGCNLEKPKSYVLSFEDSTTVPNTTIDRKCKKSRRSSYQIQDHVIAERKRRENITQLVIALSATIPGLKKIDKTSIINNAVDYVKYLEKRVRELEEQYKKRKTEANNIVVYLINMDVKARISGKNVLIKVICEKRKNIVTKLFTKLEALNLSIISTNVLPFGNSILHITIVAQVDHEFCMTMDDLVTILKAHLLDYCNLQH